jgi:glycosyltransferase involved in cell wall biosynthesis
MDSVSTIAKRKKIFFYQHVFSDYNEVLFKILKRTEYFEINYFFDQDPKNLSENMYSTINRSFDFGHMWQGRLIEIYFSYSMIWQVIKNRPDIVLSQDGSNILNNLALLFLRKLLGFRLILWGLGSIPNRRESVYKKISLPFLRLLWKNADAIISYSSFGKAYYTKNGALTHNIFVAKNAIELGSVEERMNKYRIQSSLKARFPNKNIILYVGRIENTKRLRDLILAFEMLRISNINPVLLIVGDGASRGELEKFVDVKKIRDVYFEGAKNLIEVSEYFAFAQVCVLPGEGGLVLNHSLRHGVPVVISTGDGTEFDLVNDGMNGVFFRRGDISDLATKIERVLNEPKIKINAQENAKAIPTVAQMAEVFIHAFKHVLTG